MKMAMGRFMRLGDAALDGAGAEILTSRPRVQAGGPAGLRAEALRLEEANHQPQRLSARSPHRSLS
jgi:hypothetical protein